MTHRAPRLAIRALEMIGNRLASFAHCSTRESIQSTGGRPWFSTNAALASIIRLETSTAEGHSLRQRVQWMQRSEFFFSSSEPQSLGSITPVAIWRSRFAWARGEAASSRRARKVGHIRRLGSSVRQMPQPLQAAASRQGSLSPHRRDGSMTGREIIPAAWGSAGAFSASARDLGIGRRFRVIACGSSETTLPGLRMPNGSNASLIARKAWTRSPYWRRRNCVRERPQPCSPEIVPPTSQAAA